MRYKLVNALDLERMRSYWDRISHKGSFYGKLEGENFASFTVALRESVMILEFPFGFVRVEYDKGTDKVWIHGAFWSKDVFGHLNDLKEAAKDIAKTMGTNELVMAIPVRGRALPHILERVGFQWKGTIKGFYKTRGGCFDALLYTMMVE